MADDNPQGPRPPERLTAEAFHAALGPQASQWSVDATGERALATFETRTFAAGLALVAAIGRRAEAAHHHPDVDLRERAVTVRLTTHEVGGLSDRDVVLARVISRVAGEERGADADLGARRLAVVRRHMEAENVQDFDAVIATFDHPRYELMAGDGRTFDGEAEVRRYFASSRQTYPDQRNDGAVLRLTDDGVVAEFDLLGTHVETGRAFRSRMLALFLFDDGGDGIVCERVYFDRRAVTGG